MKYLVFVCVLVHVAQSKVLPDYLKEHVCRKSNPEFEKCILNSFEKSRAHLIKGIPELSFPPIDPFELPIMTVNNTVSDVVRIDAICRNVKVIGGSNYIIDGLKADPIKQTGEIRITLPKTYLEMEYEVAGHLLVIPLQSKGFFEGNFTNTQIFAKGSLKKYKKRGVEYFKTAKLGTKITVGDGHIKLTAKNPDLQLGADLISGFFNENARTVMDAVNPIFIQSSNELFTVLADQILATLPASEWVPE